MMKRIKSILTILLTCILLGGVTVSAAQEGDVYDDANLLTAEEITALNETIAEIKEETSWNVFVVTTENAEGKSSQEYADDFFDTYSPEQEDGVAVLIDMDNREIALSTCGDAIRYLTDDRIEDILDDAYYDISDGDYEGCLMTMLEGVQEAYESGIPSDQYNYDVETGEISGYRAITWMEAAIAAVAAVISAVAVYACVVGKYRLHFGGYQYDFRENGKVLLREKEDRFVNEVTTHRRIPKQTSSGGGSHSGRSSTHRSSSGRSHGGGSRKF